MRSVATIGRTVGPRWFLALCLFSNVPLLALNPSQSIRQYAHTAWPQIEGLADSAVTAIAQTQDGYLWLGTEEAGLFHFDGVHFIPWEGTRGQVLPSRSISALQSANNGGLWIGTRVGLALLSNGNLKSFSSRNGLSGGSVLAISEDSDGILWVGTYGFQSGGVSRIDHDRVQTFGPSEGSAANGVYSIHRDRRGRLWIGGQAGLIQWGPNPSVVAPQVAYGAIASIAESQEGVLWLATSHGMLFTYSRELVEARSIVSSGTSVQPYRVLADHDGGIWVGTRGQGLFHFSLGRWERMTHADGLSGDDIFALFEDREGNVWAGTQKGIDRFREYKVTTLSTREGLPGSNVSSIFADPGGNVCMGIHAVGVYCLASHETRYLTDSSIFATVAGPAGRLAVATKGGVVIASKRGIQSFKDLDAVYAMAEDRDHSLWFGDIHKGLFWLPAGGVIALVSGDRFAGNPISSLLGDRVGRLWIGHYQGGLTLYQDAGFRDFSTAEGVGTGYVSSLFEDDAGRIWAATEGGLSLYYEDRFVTLTTGNGLPCNAIHDILEDDLGSLWLATGCGLVRVQLEALNAAVRNSAGRIPYELIRPSDGFQATARQGTKPRAAKSGDGRLWFVAEDGVAVVDPRHVPRNTVPPPVHIEQAMADGKVIDANRPVRLPPAATRLEFDYTALSFTDPERVFFRYKLEGFDASWVNAGTRRQAFYTNLHPGSYRFHVIACNNDGLWNQTGATFAFEVEPALLQTRLFAWFCAGGAMLFFWSAYYVTWHESAGLPLKNVFRAYPTGYPGLGLLLLRLAIGLDLVAHFTLFNPFLRTGEFVGGEIARALEAASGLLLMIGLLTPVVGGLLASVVVVEVIQRAASDASYASLGGAWESAALYFVVLATLTLVGPGAYSLDGRLFGSRRVTVVSPGLQGPGNT